MNSLYFCFNFFLEQAKQYFRQIIFYKNVQTLALLSHSLFFLFNSTWPAGLAADKPPTQIIINVYQLIDKIIQLVF